MEAHRVLRRRGSHIFYTIGSQMAVRLSALRAGRYLPGRFLVLISVRDWVDPGAIVRLEGLGQLKNPMTSSGIEPAASRLVAYCLNQLRYRVPPFSKQYERLNSRWSVWFSEKWLTIIYSWNGWSRNFCVSYQVTVTDYLGRGESQKSSF
jgi:hypothetical protein